MPGQRVAPKRGWPLLSCLAALASCGGEVSQHPQPLAITSSDGGISGAPFAARSAIAIVGVSADFPPSPEIPAATVVDIYEVENSCGLIRQKNKTILELTVGGTQPGRYPIVPAASVGQANASLKTLGSTCLSGPVQLDEAAGGSVTISDVAPSMISGSFSLQWADGDLTGTFAASSCSSLLQLEDDGGIDCVQ